MQEVDTAVRSISKISSRMEELIQTLDSVESEKGGQLAEVDRMQHETRSLQHEAKLKDQYIMTLEDDLTAMSRPGLPQEHCRMSKQLKTAC